MDGGGRLVCRGQRTTVAPQGGEGCAPEGRARWVGRDFIFCRYLSLHIKRSSSTNLFPMMEGREYHQALAALLVGGGGSGVGGVVVA